MRGRAKGGKGEETTISASRRTRMREIMSCPRLAPDSPSIPGKMRPSLYPTVWYSGVRLPGGSGPSEVNPVGVGLTWGRSRHRQAKTCGYSRLAPFRATWSSRILALTGVGTARLFSKMFRSVRASPPKTPLGHSNTPLQGNSLANHT